MGQVPVDRWLRDEEIDSVGSIHDEFFKALGKTQPEHVDTLKGAPEMFFDVWDEKAVSQLDDQEQ